MVIKSNRGPINGYAVMREALATRMPRGGARSASRGVESASLDIVRPSLAGAPQTGAPVPVYHLSLEQLSAEDPLQLATISSWLYPVVGGIRAGLARVREAVPGGAARFSGLSHGIVAQRFMQAALLAEQSLAADAEDFEPRLLDVPALPFVALWLHGNAATEYFIPLLEGRTPGTAPLGLVKEIVPYLRYRASQRAKRRALTPGGGGPTGTPTN